MNAQYGVFYVTNRDEQRNLSRARRLLRRREQATLRPRLDLREGLVGQSAADKRAILLDNVPSDFLRITSGLGDAAPANVIILPALFEDEVKAVIELASFSEFSDTHQSFLNQLMESVGIVLNTIAATMRTEGLLKQSQLLTAELQARQSELTKKQEELHATNEELQEKAQLLENEKKQVENKNLEIEMARRALEEKAEQLALTSKYKSEFLANMSHELRTPLNSLLILSNLLANNQQGNLNDKQVEFARTINSAGTDLLSLINDILDLSKIESGTVSIEISDMPLAHLRQHMERTFRQLAADKGLGFTIDVDPDLPDAVRTDEKRLQQIVLNLLSNAFKFTSEGEVTLSFSAAESRPSGNGAVMPSRALAIAVTDTGIGIPEDKQKLIFEAFQQADGTTSRKYGGTGLGLSISREIARLLGGELQGRKHARQGLDLHAGHSVRRAAHGSRRGRPSKASSCRSLAPAGLISEPLPEFADDRDRIMPGDRVVLVVEDDPTFGGLLLGLARSAGLKGVLSTAGSGTLALARKLMPDAITLDLGLSDIDGWVLFDLLRHDPKTRGMPIHVISGADDLDTLARKGATSVSTKPVSSEELTPRIRGHPQQQAAHAAQRPGRRCRSGPPPVAGRRDPRRRHLGDGYRHAWRADAEPGRIRRLRRDRARPGTLGKGQCADAGRDRRAARRRRFQIADPRAGTRGARSVAGAQPGGRRRAACRKPGAAGVADVGRAARRGDGGRLGRGAGAPRYRRPGARQGADRR